MLSASVRIFERLALASILAAPFAVASWASARGVEPCVRQAVALLDGASVVLRPVRARAEAEATERIREAEAANRDAAPARGVAAHSSKKLRAPVGRRATTAAAPAPAARLDNEALLPDLFVSADRVLKLAGHVSPPRGVYVAESALHPAGLRLSGVAGLGIGVQDGDILVEAMGRSPRQGAEIVGEVIRARAARARYLSGKLWRQGSYFRIVVEQPYLPAT